MANGVVIERGTSDRLVALSSASRCASPQELAIEALLPATMPTISAGQWRASIARCCQMGTAKATVTGPSTLINQWVLRAYSAYAVCSGTATASNSTGTRINGDSR